MSLNATPTRKRTHLKPDQVALLQESFNGNALPDSSVRSRLARELNVTERTIQIWFQNRRAKARKVETEYHYSKSKSVLNSGWMETNTRHLTPPRYQTTFRTMMTPERFEELKQNDGQQIRKRLRSISKPERKAFDFISHRAISEGQGNKNRRLQIPSDPKLFSYFSSTDSDSIDPSSRKCTPNWYVDKIRTCFSEHKPKRLGPCML